MFDSELPATLQLSRGQVRSNRLLRAAMTETLVDANLDLDIRMEHDAVSRTHDRATS